MNRTLSDVAILLEFREHLPPAACLLHLPRLQSIPPKQFYFWLVFVFVSFYSVTHHPSLSIHMSSVISNNSYSYQLHSLHRFTIKNSSFRFGRLTVTTVLFWICSCVCLLSIFTPLAQYYFSHFRSAFPIVSPFLPSSLFSSLCLSLSLLPRRALPLGVSTWYPSLLADWLS